IDEPSAGDLIELLKTGRRFRQLGRIDAYRLLRWMPMAVADFAGEWFESEPLRATVAAGGGPRSCFRSPGAGGAPPVLPLGAPAKDSRSRAAGWRAAGRARSPTHWSRRHGRRASR